MRREPLDRGVVELLGGQPAALRQFIGEMGDQLRDVAATLAQRRHVDRDHVEPVEQVLAKPALLDFRAEVLVGRRDHAHVHRQRLSRSDPGDHAFLQRAQHFRLCGEAHITDLIEKQRAAVRKLELARAIGKRAGEAALHVAKQLTFDQLGGDCRTIDLDEGSRGAWVQRVNRARDQLLAGAVFSRDQDSRGGRGDLFDQPDDVPNRFARPDDLVLRADFLLEPHVFGDQHDVLQRVPQRQQNTIGIEGFFEEIVRAELGCFDGGLDRAMAGDHDDLRLWVQLPHALQRLQPVHSFHLHVEEHEVRLEVGIDADRFVTRRAGLYLDFLVLEDLFQRLADPLFIVDDHHAAGTHGPVLRRLYNTTPVKCTFTSVTAGSTLTGTAPLGDAPAICLVSCVTKGPGISMPRKLISVMS